MIIQLRTSVIIIVYVYMYTIIISIVTIIISIIIINVILGGVVVLQRDAEERAALEASGVTLTNTHTIHIMTHTLINTNMIYIYI